MLAISNIKEERMKKISELKKDSKAVIASINGDSRFVSRITSIGLTPGCSISIIKNEKRRPLLVYSRDTMIALDRNYCTVLYFGRIASCVCRISYRCFDLVIWRVY